MPQPRVDGDAIDGEVVRVDRFGNLITNIDRRTFEQLARRRRSTSASARTRSSRVVSTYADAAPGEVCALFGSTDHLEIAVNGGSAADALGARPRRAGARRRGVRDTMRRSRLRTRQPDRCVHA